MTRPGAAFTVGLEAVLGATKQDDALTRYGSRKVFKHEPCHGVE